jgi:hypothetical protein
MSLTMPTTLIHSPYKKANPTKRVNNMSLRRKLETAGIESEMLDELVQDAADRMASGANNEGIKEQLEFISKAGIPDSHILAELGIE